MTIPTIPLIDTVVPDPPNRATDTSQQFADKADATVAAMPNIVDDINATATGMNAAGVAIQAVGDAALEAANDAEEAQAAAAASAIAADASADAAALSEANAANSASAAAASAGSAAGFTATSTTSLTISLGSKSLTLAQTGKAFIVGDFVVAASSASPSNFMTGQVTAFTPSTGAMTVNVTGIGGSGTIASWNVGIAGQPAAPVTSGTLSGVLNLAATQSIASAATTDIGSANSNTVTITGTTTITALGTAPDGATRNVLFSGALTLTHNATSLILPGAANIVTAAGDTAEAQSLGSGNWRIVRYTRSNGLPVLGGIRRGAPKTAGFTAGVADNGSVFELSSASAQTMAFAAAATLGASWSCWWVNTGAGIWTVDPNGSETIDGVTSYSVLPGEARLVTCDGTGFSTLMVKPFYLAMTASGTFPALAPGYAFLNGLLWGSGQGGAVGNVSNAAGAPCRPFSLPRSLLSSAQTVTIAAATPATTGGSPVDGSNSTFGSLVTARGPTGTAYPLGRANLNAGATGASSAALADPNAGGTDGNDTLYGGAAGGVAGAASPKSQNAGNGGAYTAGANGAAGQAPGGGGAAADTGFAAGAGARGELRCWGVPG